MNNLTCQRAIALRRNLSISSATAANFSGVCLPFFKKAFHNVAELLKKDGCSLLPYSGVLPE
jgi:hypothetical protein